MASSTLVAQDLSGLKVFINPGHGGYDSDDRNVVIEPFKQGDPDGFWESVSNLDKGFYLRDMLHRAGASTEMSRIQNSTADDLPLTTIVRMGNEYEADIFLSIHSNAGDGISNFPLMIFRGYTDGPERHGSKAMATHLFDVFKSNQIPTWTNNFSQVVGDWSFQPSWGTSGYGVLRGLTVDGVLSEGSFHDYIPETYRLMSQAYRKLESWHFFKSIVQHFERGEINHGNISGQVRDSRLKNEATYRKVKGRDELLPIHSAKLTLMPGNVVTHTDNLYNGVFLFDDLQAGDYQVTVEAEGYYAQTFDFAVKSGQVTYHDFLLNRVRLTPPIVTAWSPNVDLNNPVECSTPIYINFNWDMDEESTKAAFSIEPHTEGTFTFEDSQYRMRFSPSKPWEVNTTYRVKLDKSAMHPDNLTMSDDFEFIFSTKERNRLELLLSNPKAGDQEVHPRTNFQLVFDRTIKTLDINTHIKVVDASGAELAKNSRSVSNNKLNAPYGGHLFELTPALTVGQEYRLIVAGTLLDEVNMPIVEEIVIPFRAGVVEVVDQPVVESFDATALLSNEVTSNKHCTKATATRTTSRKLLGTAAWTLSTTFTQQGGEATFLSANPIDVASGVFLGLHIYGDLSGNSLEVILEEGTNRIYQTLTTLDFAAWQFREVKLEGLENGKSYRHIGYRLVAGDGPLALTNDLSMDNLLRYQLTITSTPELEGETEVRLFPNPVRDMLYSSSNDQSAPIFIQLYTLSGILVRESRTGQLSVAALPAGTYVARIETQGKQITKPIVVIQ